MSIREFYKGAIEKFEVGGAAKKILARLVADEKLSHLDSALSEDAFFTEQVITEASVISKNQPIRTLAQAVSIVGAPQVTHFVLGHTLARLSDPKADQNYKTLPTHNQKIKRATESETMARALNCPHVGSAFAAGYLFDICEEWLMSDASLKQMYSHYFSSVWTHSLRTANIAWALASHKKVTMPLGRLVFAAGLLHDIGKLLLALTFSERYHALLLKFAHLRQKTPLDDSFEAELETQLFGFAHPEAGSLLLWQANYLKEWEAALEYHHDFTFLEIRDARLNQVEVVLSIADKIAFFLDTTQSVSEGIVQEFAERHASVFPVSTREIMETLLTLRSNRLLL